MVIVHGASGRSHGGARRPALMPATRNISAIVFLLLVVWADSVRVMAAPWDAEREAVLSAASQGDVGKLRQLLDKNPQLATVPNDAGFTPLHGAAARGQLGAIRLLTARGADLNAASKALALTPLHMAARANHLETVELLVRKGADLNVEDKYGATPLELAADHPSIVDYLLTHGAKLSFRAAIWFNKTNEVAAMLEARPELLNAPLDPQPWLLPPMGTPLTFAARLGRIEIMELLIAKGADVNARTRHNAATDEWRWGEDAPLHYAAAAGPPDAIDLLLANKADINAVDQHGDTPLWRAVNKGRVTIVQLLVDRGADVNAKGQGGRAPLWEAHHQLSLLRGPYREFAKTNFQAMIEILRQHGARK